jgi:hypothetical protein
LQSDGRWTRAIFSQIIGFTPEGLPGFVGKKATRCPGCSDASMSSFRRKGESDFYIFEAPGLHFWRFLKQIRTQIGSKLTVFYKNGYHFTKIRLYY